MQTAIRFRLVGILCLMLVSAPFIVWGQTGSSPWESDIQAGEAAYEQGNYAEAEKQFLAALQEAENFGPEDPRLASSLNELVALYRAQGKDAKAEPLLKRSLVIKEKTLGPEHFDVATSLNKLAELYRAQDKYAEAEPLYRRALGIMVINLGPEHVLVAISLDNYAVLLRELNRKEEAAKMEARAQAIRAKQSEQDRAQ